MPLRLDDVAELRWYFGQQTQVDRGGAPEDFRRFRARAVALSRRRGFARSIGCGRRTAIGPLHATVSPVLEDAIARRTGPCDERRCCRMSYAPSLPPGWLGVDPADRRERRGERQTSGGVFPLLGARRGGARREVERGCASGDVRKLLRARRVADGDIARRFVPRVRVAMQPATSSG